MHVHVYLHTCEWADGQIGIYTELGAGRKKCGGEREMYRGLWEENVRKGQPSERQGYALREQKGQPQGTGSAIGA